jgi:hypothetical protein
MGKEQGHYPSSFLAWDVKNRSSFLAWGVKSKFGNENT